MTKKILLKILVIILFKLNIYMKINLYLLNYLDISAAEISKNKKLQNQMDNKVLLLR